ncbi:MAG TPA: sulfite exporter TauE/SafE family protein [Cyclobacteriaceae bacterium]|nr:sulfite exporter TauE/SafE family protein [Cyclobacteriaceae bacterium]HRW99613.1 sulfite exporter TauE/SafE family protein [Cyclobacteriaceae bacterium]
MPIWIEYPLYVVVGVLTGFLNTVAGGGSLISMPVLIFLGLPGTIANGTNRVAILTQNIFAVGGFHSKGVKLPIPYVYYLSIVSLAGGLIGAWLATDIPDGLFNRILAVVMIVVVISIVANRSTAKKSGGERLSKREQTIGTVMFFFLGIYGGFLQAGIGFLVIALLSHVNNFDLVKINYIKVFAALLYTGAAVAIFAIQDKIVWSIGITLAIGQGVGAWYASRWSVDKGEKWIKRILVVSVVAMAIKLWFF